MRSQQNDDLNQEIRRKNPELGNVIADIDFKSERFVCSVSLRFVRWCV